MASFAKEAWEEINGFIEDLRYETMAFSHPRSYRRIEDVKRKARPELNRYGWDTLDYATTFVLPPPKYLNIAREEASQMSTEEFRSKFEIPRVPCVLTGLTKDWPATEKWTTERLYRKYRNQRFKCGEDDEGYSVKIKMKYYIEYMKSNFDDSPLYIFDSSFGCRHKTKQLLEDYVIPHMFQDDLFNYAAFTKRPPHRWFVMGPSRSGTSIHIDPLGTSAWNSLIVGYKRWVMIHPNAPKEMVKPRDDEKGKHGDEAVTWFKYVYPRVVSSSWPSEYQVIECIQAPGETMFVPSGWWHVVINLTDTIAVTQNFCSVVNLPFVWPKVVKGRKKLSSHWYKRLSKERPEVIGIMDEALHKPLYICSSSDSSSSSSSSSSDSSSEDEKSVSEQSTIRKRKFMACDGNGSPTNKLMFNSVTELV